MLFEKKCLYNVNIKLKDECIDKILSLELDKLDNALDQVIMSVDEFTDQPIELSYESIAQEIKQEKTNNKKRCGFN